MTKLLFVCVFVTSAAGAHAEPAKSDRARFSGKRLAAEIVVGELVGALVTGVTYETLCDGKDCFGSALAAFGANFAVTPLAVWGVGGLMGGEGRLAYSYLGAGLAMAPFSATGPADETPGEAVARVTIEAWVSSILLAPCSALLYEATSHMSWARDHAGALSIRPLNGQTGVTGAAAVLSGRW